MKGLQKDPQRTLIFIKGGKKRTLYVNVKRYTWLPVIYFSKTVKFWIYQKCQAQHLGLENAVGDFSEEKRMNVPCKCLTLNLTNGNGMNTGALNMSLTSEERVSSRNVEGQRQVLQRKWRRMLAGGRVRWKDCRRLLTHGRRASSGRALTPALQSSRSTYTSSGRGEKQTPALGRDPESQKTFICWLCHFQCTSTKLVGQSIFSQEERKPERKKWGDRERKQIHAWK